MKISSAFFPLQRTISVALVMTIAPLAVSGTGCDQVAAPPAVPSKPAATIVAKPAPAKRTPTMLEFANPIVARDAADPYMTHVKGWYYLSFTTGNEVEIWQSRRLTDWSAARKKVVWRRKETGPMSRDIWAPEVHWRNDHWYVYFTATSNDDPARADQKRRVFTLESKTDDALGDYIERGQWAAPDADEYAIDGTIFELKNKLYAMWSGREKSAGGAQNIYIAPMSNPWTISGARVRLSTPEFGWELRGWPVNEGPAPLIHRGKLWVAYSASGGTTPDYALGLLELRGDDPLHPENWRKSEQPVFKSHEGPEGAVYTVGHNSFTESPDGHEDWNVYHGKENRDGTWGGRTMRAAIVKWRPDGSPDFGVPTPGGVPLPLPSGEAEMVAAPATSAPVIAPATR